MGRFMTATAARNDCNHFVTYLLSVGPEYHPMISEQRQIWVYRHQTLEHLANDILGPVNEFFHASPAGSGLSSILLNDNFAETGTSQGITSCREIPGIVQRADQHAINFRIAWLGDRMSLEAFRVQDMCDTKRLVAAYRGNLQK